MVRRLKEDLRKLVGGFAERTPVQVDITGLPSDAPELKLSKLLDEYRQVRQLRLAGATKRKQAEAFLLVSHLQQRLLSSVEAFARTLAVHRRTMERLWAADASATPPPEQKAQFDLLADKIDSDDDRSQLSEEEQESLASQAVEAVTAATAGNATSENIAREKILLAEMEKVADQGRSQPDARIRYLIEWIRQRMCPGTKWNDLRLLIFTEYDDTRRYLVEMLRAAIADTDLAEHRIEVYHGPTPPDKREAIKRAFNLPPHEHPIRILVATDAAREGINLQAHCHNLFHFDVPWNPSRLEQRNGRIDRKLQPSLEVFCHYFVYAQRPEDRVLRALVRKSQTIRKELGSLAAVLEERLSNTIRTGIRHDEADKLAAEIEAADLDQEKRATADEELETSRERLKLQEQIDVLRNRINDASKWIGLDQNQLRDALSCSLELLGAEPLKQTPAPANSPTRFVFPNLDTRHGADPTWSVTLDTLRAAPQQGPRNFQWRKESPIRPVVFNAPEGIDDDIVQLHLQHGRLSLYGAGAVRLHEEILSITARWMDLSSRRGALTPYAHEAEAKTLELLEDGLRPGAHPNVPDAVAGLLKSSFARDIEELLPHLEQRGQEAKTDAVAKLKKRGDDEAESIRRVLDDQKRRVLNELGRYDQTQLLLSIDLEKRQLESNRRYWDKWLANVEDDLKREPERVRRFYEVASFRIEPVGLAYLWPVTG